MVYTILQAAFLKHYTMATASTFDAIMHSVFTRRTKKILDKLISFTVTKILAAVTKYLFKIMIFALCLYG